MRYVSPSMVTSWRGSPGRSPATCRRRRRSRSIDRSLRRSPVTGRRRRSSDLDEDQRRSCRGRRRRGAGRSAVRGRARSDRASVRGRASERAVDLGSSARCAVLTYDDTPDRRGRRAASSTSARTILSRRLTTARRACSPRRARCGSAWLARLLQLAAQVADVHGEVLGVGAEVVAPDPVVDRRVVQHDALRCAPAARAGRTRSWTARSRARRATPGGPPGRCAGRRAARASRRRVVVGLASGAAGPAAGPAARRARTAWPGSRRRRHRGPATRSAVSVRAVSIRIGRRLRSARSTRHTVSPSTLGIITSRMATSGWSVSTIASAAAPSGACTTS